jgi:hypothetical protein
MMRLPEGLLSLVLGLLVFVVLVGVLFVAMGGGVW